MADIFQEGGQRFAASVDKTYGEDAEREELEKHFGLGDYAAPEGPTYDERVQKIMQDASDAAAQSIAAFEQGEGGKPHPLGGAKPAHLSGPTKGLENPDAGALNAFDENDPALAVQGMARGAAVGTLKSVQHMWNFLDALDNVAAAGFGKAANIPGSEGVLPRATFADKIPLSEDPITQGSAKVMEYAAPFALGWGTGSLMRNATFLQKVMAGAASDATVAAVAMDPNQERFTDVMVRNYPWLRSIGADFLAASPDDTEMDKRMKNAGEALMFSAGIGALLQAPLAISRWARGARVVADDIPVTAPGETPLPPPTGDEVLQGKALEKDTVEYVRKMEAELGPEATVKITPKRAAIFEPVPQADPNAAPVYKVNKVAADEVAEALLRENKPQIQLETFTGSTSALTNDAASEIIASLTEKIGAGRTGRVAISEMDAMGIEYLRTRPEDFTKLVRNHQPGTPYTDEQFAAIKIFAQSTLQDLVEVAGKAARLKGVSPLEYTDADKVLMSKYQSLRDAYTSIAPVFSGAVEVPGRQLRYLQEALPEFQGVRRGMKAVEEQARLAGGWDSVLNDAEKLVQLQKTYQESAAPTLLGRINAMRGDVYQATQDMALSGMVTSTWTTARAAVGGMIFNMSRELQKANAIIFGRVLPERLGGIPRHAWEEEKVAFMARLAGMRGSAMEAFHAAGYTLRTGDAPMSAFNFTPPEWALPSNRAAELSKGGHYFKSYLFTLSDKAREAAFKMIDYSTRPLRAADSMNAAFARRQSYIEDAAREAFAAGVDDASDVIYARTLYPTKEMVERADKLARESAYNASYDDLLPGKMGKSMEGIDEGLRTSWFLPYGKVMVPFMKTGVNDVVQTWETTPLVGVVAPRMWSAFKKGGPEAYEAMGKQMLGLEATGLILTATAFGGLELSGGEPENPALLQATRQRNPGWQPYSVKVGDTWVSYTALGPIGKLMGATADFREYAVHVSEEPDLVRHGHVLGTMAAEYLTPKQLIEDIPEMVDKLSKIVQDGKEADVAAFMGEMSTRMVPLSGALRQVRQLTDPLSRETIDASDPWARFTNQLKNMTPGMSRDLPPRRNIFGEVIQNPSYYASDVLSPFHASTDGGADPVNQELQRLGMWNTRFLDPRPGDVVVKIDMPEKILRYNIPAGMGGGSIAIPLDANQYDLYLQVAAGIRIPSGEMDSEALAAAEFDPAELRRAMAATTSLGEIPPLKETLRMVFEGREDFLAANGLLDKPQFAQDNFMRIQVRLIIEVYRKMAKAALWTDLKNQALLKKGLEDRFKALGGEE